MRSIIYVHLAFAAVASALGIQDATLRQRINHQIKHQSVQEHRFIRSEHDNEQSHFEVNPTGKLRSKPSVAATHQRQTANAADHLAPESANMAEVHQTAGDGTQTTTLSAIHLMASTTAKGLVPPPERKFADGGTTTIANAMGSTSQQPDNPLDGFRSKDLPASLVSEEDQQAPNEGVEMNSSTNATSNASNATAVVPAPGPATAPISYTAQQVQNSEAAFEVTGCGSQMAHFNGIYMPSQQTNTNPACTSLVWTMTNSIGTHQLYYAEGKWCLTLEGNLPAFNGDDSGHCAPESATTSWIIVDKDVTATGAPTINRKAAQEYTSTTTVVWSGSVGDAEPYYYVVTDAGVPGFNGVYWMTPIVIADVRCQRMFSKGGPDNTEYTLAFGNSNGREIWYFQSLIGGQTLRPYVGNDDGSCSPESVTWLTTDTGTGLVGGNAPNVARSLTYSTTTTTTTTADTTTSTTTLNITYAAAQAAMRIGVAGNLSNNGAGAGADNNSLPNVTAKGGAQRDFSMLSLRLLLSLAVAHALS